nr:Chain A, Conglutin gamma [Lupinus angustifolius]4PPH_B Chain B, Conglutin gamma [Lupinus angustifolius]4PPH_C Chain C, Conglutin gamma [Lupinus angustifolius]4PPH_D Chain D, Conglutin gamma [Lupinus angustifolius]4PPH_E Chain E, Conglutin gamma [Lupinus angustifolius]4PPH_F Chain F, Conglutin gamma [Lupinus angustifolius]
LYHNSQPTSSKPNLLVLPVQEDASTGLHWANIHKRTPLMQVPLLLDLNGKHLWVTCSQHYSSSTYQAPFCHSTQCSRANTHQCFTCTDSTTTRPGCHNNTCGLLSSNPVTQESGLGELAQDVLAIHSTHGSKLGPMVKVPQFLFSCAPSFLAQKGLPNNVQGALGLGQAPISLQNQLFSHFGLKRQFSVCLSRYSTSNGAILFGDINDPNNNNYIHNSLDVLHDLVYTPLTISKQGEYFIQVNAIRVNKHLVIPTKNPFISPSSTSYHGSGEIGGALITTTHPYTVLSHSIFEVFTQVFANNMPKQAQVKAVGPFGLCYDSRKISGGAPSVDLILDKNDAVWRISSENFMVQAQDGVSCLGFVDGGVHARAGIALGAHHLEENLVVFDLERSRVGFNSNSLKSYGKTCSNLFDLNNP